MSITKADLSDDLYKTVGLSKADATEMVEDFFEVIGASLMHGEEVKISGFGNFSLRDKEARPGRNPKTKEPAEIVARRVVTYKPSQKVKDKLRDINPSYVEISKKRQPLDSQLEDEVELTD